MQTGIPRQVALVPRPTHTMKATCVFLGILLWTCSPARAQVDTLAVALPTVEVEAGRGGSTAATFPFAATVWTRPPAQVATEPLPSLSQTLAGLPGVWLSDRNNFSLGERLSIRGMGWRSAFGVRGVQAYLDGIPLTMPDGQAVLDLVEPALVQRAEVLRGPTSALWGNAGGGVLLLSTVPPDSTTGTHLRPLGGSLGRQALTASTAATLGGQRVHLAVSHLRLDGYRTYSRTVRTRAVLHSRRTWTRTTLNLNAAWIDAPTAQNPGALTQAQVDANPRQADVRNVDRLAGKDSRQGQAGATLRRQTGYGLLSGTVYGLYRHLDNPLSFTYIRLRRQALGTRLTWHNQAGPWQWTTGIDAGRQHDDRQNRNNEAGQPGATLALNQTETVRNLSWFGTGARPWGRLYLSAGLRYDHIRFAAEDALLDNGDQSGSRTFGAWSPSLGVSVPLAAAVAFANFRMAFETPTTTELVNRPDLDGGFNPTLDPQRTYGYELGVRGAAAQVRFDVALFHMTVVDRLIPFQTEAGGDRTFYRNEGRTRHTGLETAFTWTPRPGLELAGTYTGGLYRFENDLKLPGLPTHRLYGSLQAQRRHLRVRAQVEAVGAYFADDANTAQNDRYATVHLYLSAPNLSLGHRVRLHPFFHLYNLTDARYNGSVVVNGFGGRYFEPAPGRSWVVGVDVAF